MLIDNKKNSDKEYEHVLNVLKKTEVKLMKNYHDLYLKCDILLLANVFEIFRNNSLKSLSWGAMVKMTKIKLELILESDMYIFFEKSTQDLTCIYSLRKVHKT